MSKKIRSANGQGSYRRLKDGRFGWRRTIDGVTQDLSARTMPELREKVKLVADLPIVKNKYKVCEWFDTWLKTFILPLKKDATYQQYNFIYKSHILPKIGNRKLISIKSNDIQSVIAEMNKKGMATKTMKHAKSIMNIAFGKAYKDKLIPENPVKDIEVPQKQAKPRKVLNKVELHNLFKALQDSRWIWSIHFLLVTGLRRGELLALRWSDIDFDKKEIIIDESNSLSGIGDTKSAKVHAIPLSKQAIYYLDQQKEQLRKEYNPILLRDNMPDLIFPNNKGQALKPSSYYTLIRRASIRAGIKASPHCLRHTFVYLMRDKVSLKDLQNMLGHDESTTTLDIYGDILSEANTQNAKAIDDVFNILDVQIHELDKKKNGKVLQFRTKNTP